DAKTRVGYAVSLMRRSGYNYYALTKYFESAPASDQSVWECITSDDWSLIRPNRPTCSVFSRRSSKEGIASSYELLFRN
ncbi:hypothetical protein L917_05883, partial [Phytophthora nicotianae]